MKAPYTQFDLPTKHLVGERHYVPPRARDSSEIERRHSMPSGTILLEQQHRGTLIAPHLIKNLRDSPDIAFAANIIAVCGLNSGWYEFGRGSNVMRRQTMLPYIARPVDQPLPTSGEQLLKATERLERVAASAGRLTTLKLNRKPGQGSKSKDLGRAMANAALEVAAVPLLDTLQNTQPFTVQSIVRHHSLEMLDASRNMSLQIGTPPSFAQLADPDSDLSVHIRREAPTNVYYAFEEAIELHAMPR